MNESLNNHRERRVFVERRRRKDWVVHAVNITAVIGWSIAAVSLLLIDMAKPDSANFFTRTLNINVYSVWDIQLLQFSVIVLSIALVTCVVGFIFNMKRHHRKTDRYNKSILVLGAITFAMIVYFLLVLF